MTAFFRVSMTVDVFELSKICMRIHELIDPVLVDVVVKDVEDVRIYLLPPRSAGGLMALRKEIPDGKNALIIEEDLIYD